MVTIVPIIRALISPQMMTSVNQRSGPFSRPSKSYARNRVPMIANNTLAMTK